MRILDKYIIKELLGPFLFGVAAFSSIFIGSSTLFRIAQYITKYGASVSIVVKLFVYSLPAIVVLTFPMSMLLASLMSFGRLSNSSEITAMKSGGISFYRLTIPVFIIAFFVSIFAAAFNEFVVPPANEAYNAILRYDLEKNTRPRSEEHIVIKDIKEGSIVRLTYARKFEEETNMMYGVTVQEFQNEQLVRVEHAERASWSVDKWIMYSGQVHELSPDGRVQRTLKFDEQVLPVNKNAAAISLAQKRDDEMTIKELKLHIKALKREHAPAGKYEVALHQRLSIPMASFVFAMIGTPLGLQPHRSSSSIGLGISIIIIFIYYAIMTVCTALGQGGAIPVVLAAWIPNIVGILAGMYLVRKATN